METKCDDDGNLARNDDSDTVMIAGIMTVKMLLLLLTGVIDTNPSVSPSGVDYGLVHRFPGADLCLLPRLPGRERLKHRLWHLCRLPLVGDCEYFMMQI